MPATQVESLGEAVHDVAAKHAAAHDRAGTFPAESIEALSKAGLMGLCVPTELGGKGMSFRAFASVVESVGGACASSGMIYVMHIAAAKSIEASALADKDAVLRSIAAGTHLSTLAASEKGSRSLFWMPASKLRRDGEGYKVSAQRAG